MDAPDTETPPTLRRLVNISGRIPQFGLQWQITAGLAVGLVILFGAFAAIAYNTINQSASAALKERRALAQLSAEAVDNLVAHASGQMESVKELAIFQGGSMRDVATALEGLRSSLGTFERLSLVDPDTDEVWTAPDTSSAQALDWLSSPQLVAALETGETQIFHPPPAHLESGHPALCVIAVRANAAVLNGRGVLVGELHLRVGKGGLVPLPQFSETSGTTIIDDQGRVLASTNGALSEITQDHFPLLPEFLSERTAGVAIHRPTNGKSHVVAFSPFLTIPGGVVVEEREDVVLAVSQHLRRNLILFGTLSLVLSSIFAWLHVRHTMKPVRRLTSASRAIAEGVLDQPIEVDRGDEIGVLAQSFEAMRQKLGRAERQRIEWEQEMEWRVTERTERVETLLARVISAQEEERKRVARELHDDVAQDLATLLMTLQRLSQSPTDLEEADRASLEQAQQRLGGTLREMRRMISDLRPAALDDLGLEAAIRGYAETRAEEAGLRLQFNTVGDTPGMDAAIQTALFRILQEAINNVIRHAEADQLWITLRFTDAEARATVQDDGGGFEVDSIGTRGDSGSQLGILGMKERAGLLNGRVDVDSQPSVGTTVRVWIPLSD